MIYTEYKTHTLIVILIDMQYQLNLVLNYEIMTTKKKKNGTEFYGRKTDVNRIR